jgi:hypothetical protein
MSFLAGAWPAHASIAGQLAYVYRTMLLGGHSPLVQEPEGRSQKSEVRRQKSGDRSLIAFERQLVRAMRNYRRPQMIDGMVRQSSVVGRWRWHAKRMCGIVGRYVLLLIKRFPIEQIAHLYRLAPEWDQAVCDS